VSASEALEFAGSESDSHALCSCPIAGRQKEAEITQSPMNISKRFGKYALQDDRI
jgi:hypothetical protein